MSRTKRRREETIAFLLIAACWVLGPLLAWTTGWAFPWFVTFSALIVACVLVVRVALANAVD